jgi:hypothetical protein
VRKSTHLSEAREHFYDAKNSMDQNSSSREPSIRDLYPDLRPEQQKEAEDNLGKYLEFALRIYERIIADPEEYEKFRSLTGSQGDPKMR